SSVNYLVPATYRPHKERLTKLFGFILKSNRQPLVWGGYFFLSRNTTIATIKVSIAMIDKLNCATKLNASNIVILPPPLKRKMANRPLCFCSCCAYFNIE